MSSKAVPVEGLRPVPAVGVVCIRGEEVLLVRRGTPPKLGEWSIPGGRIEPGERGMARKEGRAVVVGVVERVDDARRRALDELFGEWVDSDSVLNPLHQVRAQPLYFLESDGSRDHV